MNKNIVLVLENGSALDLSEPSGLASAIPEAWYPGDRGGDALADILFGKAVPSGRLPLGFPARTEDLPPFDDYENKNGRTYMYRKIKPLYDFGFGLSYTTFAYSGISAEDKNISVTMRNTGAYAAEEVVQLYINSAGLAHQPRVRLQGFRRVSLQPGEEARVTFALTGENFFLFDENGERKLFPGTYTVFIDGHLPDENSEALTITIG